MIGTIVLTLILTIDLITKSLIVLVVEKEATFHWLQQETPYLRSILGDFILVTGKGYPCLATRQLLFALEIKYPNINIFGIFDYDPYGIDIYCGYRFGSRQMSHESNTAVVSSMIRIGISMRHFVA